MNQKDIDILEKVDEMIDGGVKYFLKVENIRLLRSGGIDTSKHEFDSYLIPKIILTVALQNCSLQYQPDDKKGKKEMKNLSYF